LKGLAHSLLKKFRIALLYRSCHSDAERGGGICDTEKLCGESTRQKQVGANRL
jgi:hypothetical protein